MLCCGDGRRLFFKIILVFSAILCYKINRQLNKKAVGVGLYCSPVKRETGENPVRSRHCN